MHGKFEVLKDIQPRERERRKIGGKKEGENGNQVQKTKTNAKKKIVNIFFFPYWDYVRLIKF